MSEPDNPQPKLPSTVPDSNSDFSPAEENPKHRPVRSFVLRGGRLTEGQKRALDDLWPKYGLSLTDGPLAMRRVFGNNNPTVVEIGFGNGDSTWQMAKASPGENFIGVEVHRPGVGHLMLKLEEHAIGNVRVACEDAVEFLRDCITAGSLDGVRLYFPDPWPKARHHKRRIVQTDFVNHLAGKLANGGIFHMATDWAPYAEHMLEVMNANDQFVNISESGDYCPRPAWRPLTKYEKRGERLGHAVFDLLFMRSK